MIAPACELLTCATCPDDGPFVEPDLVLKYTHSKERTPETCTFTIVYLDGKFVNIPLDSDEIEATIGGITNI